MKKILIAFFSLLMLTNPVGEVRAQEAPMKATSVKDVINLIPDHAEGVVDYTFNPDGSGDDPDVNYDGALFFRYGVDNALNFLKQVLYILSILIMVRGGIGLFLSRGSEEVFEAKKTQMYATFLAFIMILGSAAIVDLIFFGTKGEFLRDEGNTELFGNEAWFQALGLFDYINSFAVILAVAFIIFSAFKLMVAGGEDEGEIANIKKRLIFSLTGIAILAMMKVLVGITRPGGRLQLPQLWIDDSVSLMMRWANLFLSFVAIIAVIALIWAGARLVMRFEDEQAEDEAKRIVISAVIGLLVAFSAWTIVYFIVRPIGM